MKHVEIFIDQRRYELPGPTTGEALYRLGNVGPGLKLYREVRGDREDQAVENDQQQIHLTEFEHFHSGPPTDTDFTVFVNARKKRTLGPQITFNRVVALAFNPVPTGPNIVITVTYRHGPHPNPDGILAEGENVWIKNEMVFHVKATDRS